MLHKFKINYDLEAKYGTVIITDDCIDDAIKTFYEDCIIGWCEPPLKINSVELIFDKKENEYRVNDFFESDDPRFLKER